MREDLLALDTNALIMLANRGLVKRAGKELAKGQGPRIQLLADGTLVGQAEAVVTRFPPEAPFQNSECSCGALRACRHRVALVMAYQAQAGKKGEEQPTTFERPPFQISEELLRAQVGTTAFLAAERQRGAGYVATVRFSDPPVAVLPTCTVTFLVPWHLAHVRCDCVEAVNCHHLVMAVWALREIEDDGGEHVITIAKTKASLQGGDTLIACRQFAEHLLLDGWSGSLEGIHQRVNRLRTQLKRARFVWLDDLLEELLTAIGEHEQGTASADVYRCSTLLNEMMVRCRVKPSANRPQRHLHGEGITDATKLDHTVLRGLGARYRVNGRRGKLSLFFREGNHKETLVLERDWLITEGETPTVGSDIAGRKLLGSTVEVLANGNVVTRGATRKPNRIIELCANRLQTSVMRGRDRHLELDSDFGALRDRLANRNLAELSPRVRAQQVVAIAMGRVVDVGYDPVTQKVWGLMADPEGTQIMVASEWLPEVPAGPALLARALLEGAKFLTAEASLRRGLLYLDPIAIGFAEKTLSVDLQQSLSIPELPVSAMPGSVDPINAHLESLDDWLHSLGARGLAHITGSQMAYGRAQVRHLEDVGLSELATLLNSFVQNRDNRLAAWRKLATRVLVMSHLLTKSSEN